MTFGKIAILTLSVCQVNALIHLAAPWKEILSVFTFVHSIAFVVFVSNWNWSEQMNSNVRWNSIGNNDADISQ